MASVAELESVHLELGAGGQVVLGEQLADVLALVALQLENLAVLGVLDHRAVTRKLLSTAPG